ncbi:MAG: protein translocase subunit SecD [Nanoarchaeota archaeon]|nr:protein translocase subunit SecD [Nanoarchaeota archaeon]
MKWVNLFKDWRIILMLSALIISIIAINPRFDTTGVLITSVSTPALNYIPTGVKMINLNGIAVNNLTDYDYALSTIKPGDSVTITYIGLDNNQVSTSYPFLAMEEDGETKIGLAVSTIPFSNLEFGLDLNGGTKVILKPEVEVTNEELTNIIGIIEQRLNVYGFKEIPINTLSDFSGNDYIKVELPSSVSVSKIEDLLQHEGVFEARIGNNTVFTGDDILTVCVTGVDCQLQIKAVQGGFIFQFELAISEEGAERFANKTSQLAMTGIGTNCYLNETINFYLDNEFLDGSDLKISCDLQGLPERNPIISGGGQTRDEVKEDMKKLQSMLQSKNLPVGLSIESVEVISPKLGQEFLQNILYVFLLAILGVDVLIAIKYKSFRIAIPIIIVTLSEIIITLGVATLFSWTFDLAAIAGLIASVGTGVDDQIVITDEVLNEDKKEELSFKQKVKNAFFIVFATFTTSIAVMIPLTQAGAGILKGFATTTIIAISVGVLITRPAYARILEIISKD